MRILVTGGAGFIGSHVVEQLLEKGHEVTVVDNFSGGRWENLKSNFDCSSFYFGNIDIRNKQALQPAFNKIDRVIHLAGLADIVPSIENPEEYYSVNVTGTLNVLECAREHNIEKIVYAASSSCYGIADHFPTNEDDKIKPEYPYALTKYMGEELVMHWNKVYNLSAISLRLFNVYGPRVRTNGAYGAVFGVFLAQRANNKPLTIVGSGTQTRDFTYVTDVARAFVMAVESDVQGVMNVGSGKHQTINRLAELIGGETIHLPSRPGEPDSTFANIGPISGALGWNPEVSFEEGVANMLSDIDRWKDAPLWDEKSIEYATKSWFECLGGNNATTRQD